MQNARYFLAQLLYVVSRIISQEMKHDDELYQNRRDIMQTTKGR